MACVFAGYALTGSLRVAVLDAAPQFFAPQGAVALELGNRHAIITERRSWIVIDVTDALAQTLLVYADDGLEAFGPLSISLAGLFQGVTVDRTLEISGRGSIRLGLTPVDFGRPLGNMSAPLPTFTNLSGALRVLLTNVEPLPQQNGRSTQFELWIHPRQRETALRVDYPPEGLPLCSHILVVNNCAQEKLCIQSRLACGTIDSIATVDLSLLPVGQECEATLPLKDLTAKLTLRALSFGRPVSHVSPNTASNLKENHPTQAASTPPAPPVLVPSPARSPRPSPRVVVPKPLFPRPEAETETPDLTAVPQTTTTAVPTTSEQAVDNELQAAALRIQSRFRLRKLRTGTLTELAHTSDAASDCQPEATAEPAEAPTEHATIESDTSAHLNTSSNTSSDSVQRSRPPADNTAESPAILSRTSSRTIVTRSRGASQRMEHPPTTSATLPRALAWKQSLPYSLSPLSPPEDPAFDPELQTPATVPAPLVPASPPALQPEAASAQSRSRSSTFFDFFKRWTASRASQGETLSTVISDDGRVEVADLTDEEVTRLLNGVNAARIHTLSVHHSRLSGYGPLFNGLMNPGLTCLDLSDNNLTPECAAALVGLLRRLPALRTIDLSGNPEFSEGISAVCSAIIDAHKAHRPQGLSNASSPSSPSSTPEAPRSASPPRATRTNRRQLSPVVSSRWGSVKKLVRQRHLAENLPQFYNLSTLCLGETGLESVFMRQFPELLSLGSLTALDLSRNPLTRLSLQILCGALPSAVNLSKLFLSDLPEVHDWAELFRVLPKTRIQSLDLSCNDIPNHDLRTLLRATLPSATELKTLNLSRAHPFAVTSELSRWVIDATLQAHRANRTLNLSTHAEVPICFGWSGLHYACLAGDVQSIETLLVHFDNPLERDAYGRTLLHLCAEAGSARGCDAVIESVSRALRSQQRLRDFVNYTDMYQESALSIASLRGFVPVVQRLTERGAQVSKQCFEAMLELHTAHAVCVDIQKQDDDRREREAMLLVKRRRLFSKQPPSPRAPQAAAAAAARAACQPTEAAQTPSIDDHYLCAEGLHVIGQVIDVLAPLATGPLRNSAFTHFGRAAMFYFVYLVVLTLVVANHSTHFHNSNYNFIKVVNDQLTGEESLHRIGTDDITQIDDFWTMLTNALFPTEEEQKSKLVLLDYNRVVGAVRIRQKRVRNNTCHLYNPDFRAVVENCYGKYTPANEDTSTFGDRPWHTWHSRRQLSGRTFKTKLGNEYDGGGYVVDIPAYNRTAAQNTFRELTTSKWINDPTRLVLVEFTLFNPYMNQFIFCCIGFEVPVSGGIFPTETFVSLRLDRYEAWQDFAVLFLELILFACFCRLVLDEVQDIANWWQRFNRERTRVREVFVGIRMGFLRFGRFIAHSFAEHLLTDWNCLDFMCIVCLLIMFYLRALILAESYKLWGPDLLVTHHRFFNFNTIAHLNSREQETMAIGVMLSWLKIFKYVVILPTIGPVVQAIISTVVNANVLIWMMLFVIVLSSLSLGLHFALGKEVSEYNTLGASVMSLMRMIFGDFDSQWKNMDRTSGQVMLIFCLILGNLILLNILLAVLDNVYSAQLQRTTESWQRKAILQYQHQLQHARRPLGDNPATIKAVATAERRRIARNHYVISEEAIALCAACKSVSLSDVSAELSQIHGELSALRESLSNNTASSTPQEHTSGLDSSAAVPL